MSRVSRSPGIRADYFRNRSIRTVMIWAIISSSRCLRIAFMVICSQLSSHFETWKATAGICGEMLSTCRCMRRSQSHLHIAMFVGICFYACLRIFWLIFLSKKKAFIDMKDLVAFRSGVICVPRYRNESQKEMKLCSLTSVSLAANGSISSWHAPGWGVQITLILS